MGLFRQILVAACLVEAALTLTLVNVTLHSFDSTFVRKLDPYLTLLKISRSRVQKIEENAFDSLAHLNLLEISDSELTGDIPAKTFSGLHGLQFLILKGLGLRKANLELTHVQELILAENELESLGGIVAGDLTYLDVRNNKLRALRESFERLGKLSVIDVSKNEISDVGDVFGKNQGLLKIHASENKISSLEGLRLPWLKTLDLFDNRIVALDSASLARMEALEELVLAFNGIRRMEDPFKDLSELKVLNLAWNYIDGVSPDLFRNNLYLSKLSLQGNKIKVLERFVSVHPHLTQLDLSHNEIVLVHDDFFLSLPSLQVLDLSFNRLKTVTDVLAPLSDLRVLDLAFNRIVFSGYEFSVNSRLSRVNLSANALEAGLELFAHNPSLTHLDVSFNAIADLCQGESKFPALLKINLKGNHVRNASCLGGERFRSLCEVDLRNNPLECGKSLDGFVLELASRRASPYGLPSGAQSDVAQNQCESLSPSRSFHLWNSVKRDLCPQGEDIEPTKDAVGGAEEWETVRGPTEPAAESVDVRKEATFRKRLHVRVPIGWISRDSVIREKNAGPQSVRSSWEHIDEHPDLLKDLEEEEEAGEAAKRTRYSWYTIALVLIGLSLTLTCFNLVVFLYIRLRLWKRASAGPAQKYTILQNEVYKNTTEPSRTTQEAEGEWVVPRKDSFFGRVTLKLGLQKKGGDSESVQNILIGSTAGAAHPESLKS